MNINLRALIFGTAVAAALTVTMNTVAAAEPVQVIRLDTVQVVGHRVAFEADRTVDVVRLDPVVVTAHHGAVASV